ncbi:hypothetical protein AB0C90_39085 [Streptomyces sp. NPDC048550]|uniref:hypothetical protein n=1 Tax=Streptomyces sp. NPDC048550 TaxID=3155739 RepID=UPI00343253BF
MSHRNARLTVFGGRTLVEHAAVDEALNQWLPERLLTAVFAYLALQTGERTSVNCGHLAPLPIRRHRVVPAALEREVQLPSVSPRPTPIACRASSSTLNSSPRTAS